VAELPLIGDNSYSSGVLITTNQSVSMATPKKEYFLYITVHYTYRMLTLPSAHGTGLNPPG